MAYDDYIVEFSDSASRMYNDMPHNTYVEASNKKSAKVKAMKVIRNLKKRYPNSGIRFEGVYKK